jgi:hypothetical protein
MTSIGEIQKTYESMRVSAETVFEFVKKTCLEVAGRGRPVFVWDSIYFSGHDMVVLSQLTVARVIFLLREEGFKVEVGPVAGDLMKNRFLKISGWEK